MDLWTKYSANYIHCHTQNQTTSYTIERQLIEKTKNCDFKINCNLLLFQYIISLIFINNHYQSPCICIYLLIYLWFTFPANY